MVNLIKPNLRHFFLVFIILCAVSELESLNVACSTLKRLGPSRMLEDIVNRRSHSGIHLERKSPLYNHNMQQEGTMMMSHPKSLKEVDVQPSFHEKLIAKIGSSTSTVVAGTFFIVLAYQRNSFMLTFFVGSILNGITSKVLKKVLNQDRPTGYEQNSSVKVKPSDKGMPSSHAMSLGFIGVYTGIALCHGVLSSFGIKAQIVACFTLALYVALSLIYRVQSQLHTTDQVIVGLFFGGE